MYFRVGSKPKTHPQPLQGGEQTRAHSKTVPLLGGSGVELLHRQREFDALFPAEYDGFYLFAGLMFLEEVTHHFAFAESV